MRMVEGGERDGVYGGEEESSLDRCGGCLGSC